MKFQTTHRFSSFWIGIHYSKYNKRWCINLVPTFTIALTNVKKGGNIVKNPNKFSFFDWITYIILLILELNLIFKVL